MIFFIHIPKTAGVSVFDALRRILPPGNLAWHTNQDTIPRKFLANKDARESASIYGGHFGYNDILDFLTSGDKIYSVIREPVERALSLYNHITVRDLTHPLREQIKDRSLSDASKNSPRFLWEISNAQCWFLSGVKTHMDAIRAINSGRIKVFTMDTLDEMILEISRDLAVESPTEVGRHNVALNDYRSRVTADDLEFVRELNREDTKLFNWLCRAAGKHK